MRKLARLIPLALVLLPGCVFHMHGNDWDDEGERPSLQRRVDQLDRRVRDLEEAMAQGSTMHGTGTGKPAPGAPAAGATNAPAAEVHEVHAPAPK